MSPELDAVRRSIDELRAASFLEKAALAERTLMHAMGWMAAMESRNVQLSRRVEELERGNNHGN